MAASASIAAPTPRGALATPVRSERLMSLDFFRGLTIALMILVNNNGDWKAAYWPLQHSKWNGWTPTDLVFPFFLFIVGVSMVYSISSRLARGDSRPTILKHVFIRGVILFAIGVFVINSFPDRYNIHTMRVEGVLQRIAVCYVIAAIIVLWGNTRICIATIISCLAGYWLLMRFVPVPGYGVPTHDIPLLDPDRNLAAWLDRKLLFGHLYEGTRDPEGVLSTIPAIAGTLCGVLTGVWLRTSRSLRSKVAWMLVWGVVGLGAGKFFDLWFPINKKLWTSSFVLFTTGFALVVLALCLWLFDIRKLRGKWNVPVLVFGMNAIAAYVFSEVLAEIFGAIHFHTARFGHTSLGGLIYEGIFHSPTSPPSANASLAYSLSFVFFCWFFMWLLYRKRIFLKI